MLSDQNNINRSDKWDERLAAASDITCDLVLEIVERECTRVQGGGLPAISRIRKLIDCGAWTDLALALVQFELPAWRLRRLVYDGGEWQCAISRHPDVPVEIDDCADARHAILPLAILSAFIQARRLSRRPLGIPTVPRSKAPCSEPMCCDNFA